MAIAGREKPAQRSGRAGAQEGEQIITKHGRPVVVVVSVERMKRIKRSSSLLAHLRKCPSPGIADLAGKRSRETSRTLRLGS